jgi:hypothetical protein
MNSKESEFSNFWYFWPVELNLLLTTQTGGRLFVNAVMNPQFP